MLQLKHITTVRYCTRVLILSFRCYSVSSLTRSLFSPFPSPTPFHDHGSHRFLPFRRDSQPRSLLRRYFHPSLRRDSPLIRAIQKFILIRAIQKFIASTSILTVSRCCNLILILSSLLRRDSHLSLRRVSHLPPTLFTLRYFSGELFIYMIQSVNSMQFVIFLLNATKLMVESLKIIVDYIKLLLNHWIENWCFKIEVKDHWIENWWYKTDAIKLK